MKFTEVLLYAFFENAMSIHVYFIPVKLQGLLAAFMCRKIFRNLSMHCAYFDSSPATRLPYVGVRGMLAHALPAVTANFEYTAEERVASNAN